MYIGKLSQSFVKDWTGWLKAGWKHSTPYWASCSMLLQSINSSPQSSRTREALIHCNTSSAQQAKCDGWIVGMEKGDRII